MLKDTFSMKVYGTLLAGGTLCCNEVMKLLNDGLPINTLIPICGSFVAGGFLIDKLRQDNKYEKLFRMCGIENKEGKIPYIIKKTEKDDKITLVINLPEGLSQKHFEQKQEELEQFLNCKIEFGFNKNLIMDLIKMNLKTNYPYQFRQYDKPSKVFCGIGYNEDFYIDFEKDQHIIVAGETDSGKSSLITNMVLSYILSDYNIDLYLVDFQSVTLGIFEDCKKVKAYAETPEQFEKILDELKEESHRRIKLFRSVKNKIYIDKLETWNEEFPNNKLPYKLVFIDEFARLAKDYEDILDKFKIRVSEDRKAGIHYCISLQRPDVSIIEGAIKANMTTRIAFKVASGIDSEVILGGIRGAEKIKNQGRFITKHRGEVKEVQALYIKPKDIRKILKQYDKYKSPEDIKQEQKEQMDKLRVRCINPYLKKDIKDVSNNDNAS